MSSRIAEPSPAYSQANQRQIIRSLAARLDSLEKRVGPYTVSGYTITRTLNMSTATATDIGNFIATLVSDLQAIGRISK